MNNTQSKIDQLISAICPNGVEFKGLSSIASITTGKLNANAMVENGKYPFFTCAENPFLIDDYAFDTEAILISGNGSQVGHINYFKGRFNAYQRTYVLSEFSNAIHVKFLLHCLKGYLKEYILKNVKEGSVPYITLPMLQKFKIPIPPLEVQEEIVDILDKFTQLEAELEAELEARKKQYEYYRDEMLSFGDGDIELRELNQIAKVSIGEFVHKNKQNPDGKYPVFNGGISETGFYDDFNNTGDKILISARGANAGFVNKILKPYWAGNSCYSIDIIDKEKINWIFIFYYLKNSQNKLTGDQQKGGIPAVSKKQVEKFKIPIPPLSEQDRIVSILDKFDALVNDISIGLPAEIKARRKQYEYYRGKLLTFNELEK